MWKRLQFLTSSEMFPQINEEQAHELAEAIGGKSDVATKADIANLCADLCAELHREIAKLKVELIKWMIGTNFTTIAIVVTLIKLL